MTARTRDARDLAMAGADDDAGRDAAAERDAALRRLVDRAGGRGFAIAFDLLRDRAEAEDAVQESLARACAGYRELRDPDGLAAWFHRVLVNHCMRTLRRRRLFALFLPRREADPPEDVPELDLPSSAPAADDALALATDSRRLCAEVDRLPTMQRVAVVLRYAHDLSIDDIAAALDVAPETARTHLKRALARLRTRMARP